jgi:hypothetical protein
MLEWFLLLLPTVGGLAAVIAWMYFGERGRVRRRLKKELRVDIADATDGPVKIAGKLRTIDEPQRAPLSGRPCALYEVIVTELPRDSEEGRRVIIRDRVAKDFLLDDGTGTALVRASVVQTELDLAIQYDRLAMTGVLFGVSTVEADPAALEAYLAQHGQKATRFLGGARELEYMEGVFEAGELIAVHGEARREDDPSGLGGSYRERATRLVIEPLEGKLTLTDEPSITKDAGV